MLNAARLPSASYPSPQMPQRKVTHLYITPATLSNLNGNNTLQDKDPGGQINGNNNCSYQENITRPTTATAPATPPPTDIIGMILGDFGIWQLRSVLIIFLNKIPAAWFMACLIFTAPEIYPRSEFQCEVSDLLANQSISADQCYILEANFSDSSLLVKEKCTHFVYDYSFQSLIMQFNLVCSRDILVAWTQFWHLFGVLVGGIVGTKLMLKISPKRVYFIGMVFQIIFGVVTGYARDFNVHVGFRCLAAICCAIMFTAGQAIFADITGGRYRTGIIVLYDTFWSIGVILLPGVSSFFDDWTYIYMGITFPTFILIILLIWTPDSPRWLLKNGSRDDVDRVENLIRDAATINDRTFKIPTDFRQQLEKLRTKLQTQPAPAGWTKLWSGHRRAKTHLIAAHIAAAAFLVNYMLMLLNVRSFGRDYLTINTVTMGFAEIIGCFLALHFTLKHNKWKYQFGGVFNIVAGLIGCLGWIFYDVDTISPGIKVTLWMIIATIPKTRVSIVQSLLAGNVAELLPANKKIPFVFSMVTWARIWLLVALVYNVYKKTNVALSLTFHCVLSIIGGICTCLLLTPTTAPTTNNQQESSLESNKKEESHLPSAIWTVQDDVHNTRPFELN